VQQCAGPRRLWPRWDLGSPTENWRRIKLAGRIAGGVTGTVAGFAGLSLVLLLRQAADARRVIPMAEAPPAAQ
jgi:hypothetical protein